MPESCSRRKEEDGREKRRTIDLLRANRGELDRPGQVVDARAGLLVVVQPRLVVARSIDRSPRKVERWPSETRGFLGRKEDLEFMSRAIPTQLRSLWTRLVGKRSNVFLALHVVVIRNVDSNRGIEGCVFLTIAPRMVPDRDSRYSLQLIVTVFN